MARWVRLVLVPLVALSLTLLATCGVWMTGRISRVKVSALSPAGDVEAVCRGRLPESTEYDLWLRRWWQPFGTRAGVSGTESMGRCRQVLWSPDGQFVMVVNEGNYVAFFDGRTGQLRGTDRLAPGETGSYPSQRIVTEVHFLSNAAIAFRHCHRRWHRTQRLDDVSRCDGVPVQGQAKLSAEGAVGRDVAPARILLTSTGRASAQSDTTTWWCASDRSSWSMTSGQGRDVMQPGRSSCSTGSSTNVPAILAAVTDRSPSSEVRRR